MAVQTYGCTWAAVFKMRVLAWGMGQTCQFCLSQHSAGMPFPVEAFPSHLHSVCPSLWTLSWTGQYWVYMTTVLIRISASRQQEQSPFSSSLCLHCSQHLALPVVSGLYRLVVVWSVSSGKSSTSILLKAKAPSSYKERIRSVLEGLDRMAEHWTWPATQKYALQSFSLTPPVLSPHLQDSEGPSLKPTSHQSHWWGRGGRGHVSSLFGKCKAVEIRLGWKRKQNGMCLHSRDKAFSPPTLQACNMVTH